MIEKSCRNRKTGEISTIVSESIGNSVLINISGKDGQLKSIDIDEFRKDYEVINVDITSVIPNLQSYFEICPKAKSIFFSLLRRIHPGGYFHVGDLVYIDYETSCLFFATTGRSELNLFGPSNPYIITKIYGDKIIIHKYISTMPDAEQYKGMPGEIVLPRYTKLEDNDAYSILARYDTEY